MKTKVLLPVMAFVFAIGLSFATEKSAADPSSDWIRIDGTMQSIPEVDCGEGTEDCAVLHPNGNTYDVYDAQFDAEPKVGDGDVIEL